MWWLFRLLRPVAVLWAKTNEALSPSCVGAVLKEGHRFSVHTSKDELKQWSESYNLGK